MYTVGAGVDGINESALLLLIGRTAWRLGGSRVMFCSLSWVYMTWSEEVLGIYDLVGRGLGV